MTVDAHTVLTDGFIEPLDVLRLRGNLLFGAAGSYGESRMPPNPSVVSGALRSALLVRRGVDPAVFARDMTDDDLMGRPSKPGPFTLCELQPARGLADGGVEPLHAIPADLVATQGLMGATVLRALAPTVPPNGLAGSAPLPLWAVLSQRHSSKPTGGLRMTAQAWQRHLDGTLGAQEAEPAAGLTVAESELWQTDLRVGIGLDAASGRADDGKLFSSDALALRAGVGLLVRVLGTDLPAQVLRLGGDGHGARLRPVQVRWPEPDYAAIAASGCARLILTSPGLFACGWLPSGAGSPDPYKGASFELGGVRGRIVCAATPRGQVVSGFDIAQWQPKPAQRAAAIGSVYWIDDLEASADDLRKLANAGLWQADEYSRPRRAEGYNRFTWASWHRNA